MITVTSQEYPKLFSFIAASLGNNERTFVAYRIDDTLLTYDIRVTKEILQQGEAIVPTLTPSEYEALISEDGILETVFSGMILTEGDYNERGEQLKVIDAIRSSVWPY